MIGVEQRLTVRHFRIAGQYSPDQIADGGSRSKPHCLRDTRQHIQVVVDDSLAVNAEKLTIGGQCNRLTTILNGDIFILRPGANLTQRCQ